MARKNKKAGKSGKKNKSQFMVGGLKSTETRKLVGKGPHVAKLIEVEPNEGDAGPYLGWKFQVTQGKFKGSQPRPFITTLAEGKLWSLKKVLAALGSDAIETDDEFDASEVAESLIDQECVIIVGHEDYEGKPQARIVEFGDEDDVDAGDEDADEDEDEEEEDEKPSKKSSKKESGKKSSKKKDEEEEDEDEDEDEDGDDEPSEDSINDMDADELEEFCAENELEVDLPKKLSKARAAVVKAAKKAKLI